MIKVVNNLVEGCEFDSGGALTVRRGKGWV